MNNLEDFRFVSRLGVDPPLDKMPPAYCGSISGIDAQG